MAQRCQNYEDRTGDVLIEPKMIGLFATERLVDTVRYAGLTEGDRILDLGCGYGSTLIACCETFGVQGLGVDISRNGMYVEFRDHKLEKANVDVSFFLATVSEKQVLTKGRVVWVNQGHPRPNLNMPQGFGVEFQLTSEESRAIISKYLEEN